MNQFANECFNQFVAENEAITDSQMSHRDSHLGDCVSLGVCPSVMFSIDCGETK